MDNRPILLEIERPCQWDLPTLQNLSRVERNKYRNIELRNLYQEQQCLYLSCAVKCNTSIRVLSSNSVARATMFYTVKYVCKCPVSPSEFTTIALQACVKTSKYPSEKTALTPADKEKNDNCLRLNRMIMGCYSHAEYTSTQMASCVLNHPAHYQSHYTKLIFYRQAREYQRLCHNFVENSNPDVSFVDNSDLNDFIVPDGEISENFDLTSTLTCHVNCIENDMREYSLNTHKPTTAPSQTNNEIISQKKDYTSPK